MKKLILFISAGMLGSCVTVKDESTPLREALKSIPSEVECNMSVKDTVINKDSTLILTIQSCEEDNAFVTGRVFTAVYEKLKKENLRFDKYIMRNNQGTMLFSIQNKYADDVLKIKARFMKDAMLYANENYEALYKRMAPYMKERMDSTALEEFKKHQVDAPEYNGFCFTEDSLENTYISFYAKNSANQGLILSYTPGSDKQEIMGIQLK